MQPFESTNNIPTDINQVDQLISLADVGMATMDAGKISRLRNSVKQFISVRYGSKNHFNTSFDRIDPWSSQHNLQEIKGLLLAIKDDILSKHEAYIDDDKLVGNLLGLFYNHVHYNWEAINNLILLDSEYFEYTVEAVRNIFQKFIDRKIIAYTGIGYAYCITEQGKKLYERKYAISNSNSIQSTNHTQTTVLQSEINSQVPYNSNNLVMTEVFLSYSWDSEYHQKEVAAFVNFLRENGYDAQMDLMLAGQETAIDFAKMMHKAIQQSKKVIIILTNGYKEKAENFTGGVGQEYVLLFKDIEKSPQKYILVSFSGIDDDIIPFGLRGREIVDCSKPDWDQKLFSKLSNEIRYSFSEVASSKPIVQKIQSGKFIKEIRSKTTSAQNDNAVKIRASLKMEQRIRKDLIDHKMMKERTDRVGMFPGTDAIFISSRTILRSIDDDKYPEVDDEPNGNMSSWVREHFYDLTSKGIEIWIAAAHGTEIIMDHNGNWEILSDYDDDRKSDPRYKSARIMIIGTIPYYAIVDYRRDGDEYYNEPHIFCRFDFNGTPFINRRYQIYYGEQADLPTYELALSKKTKFER